MCQCLPVIPRVGLQLSAIRGLAPFLPKPPVQQTARDQPREPERRWSRDVESRSIDSSTAGRRLDNDDGDEGDDAGFNDSPRR